MVVPEMGDLGFVRSRFRGVETAPPQAVSAAAPSMSAGTIRPDAALHAVLDSPRPVSRATDLRIPHKHRSFALVG